MGLLQNLSKRGRLSEKVFDTLPQKIHAQADAAADAVCQTHDHRQPDALEHQRVPVPHRAYDTGDEKIPYRIQILTDAQPGFRGPRPRVT